MCRSPRRNSLTVMNPLFYILLSKHLTLGSRLAPFKSSRQDTPRGMQMAPDRTRGRSRVVKFRRRSPHRITMSASINQ